MGPLKAAKRSTETLTNAKMMDEFWSGERLFEEKTAGKPKEQMWEMLEDWKNNWRKFSHKFGNRLEDGRGIPHLIQMINTFKNHETKGYVVLLDLIRKNKGVQGEKPDVWENPHKK